MVFTSPITHIYLNFSNLDVINFYIQLYSMFFSWRELTHVSSRIKSKEPLEPQNFYRTCPHVILFFPVFSLIWAFALFWPFLEIVHALNRQVVSCAFRYQKGHIRASAIFSSLVGQMPICKQVCYKFSLLQVNLNILTQISIFFVTVLKELGFINLIFVSVYSHSQNQTM